MATLETGAWPAQHGIVGNVYHQAGDPLSRPTYAYSDGTFTSETLWEAAMRQGKHAIRLGTLFPRSAGSSDAGGADPTISSGGAGTVRSLPQPEAVGPGGIVSLEVESESTTWTRADPVQDALEVNRLTAPSGGQMLKLSGRADEPFTLELRVFAAGPAGSDPGFERLLLDDDEDFDNGIRAEVRPGEWATVVVDPAPPAIATRVKLLDLDAQSGRARLYVRPVYRNRGSPADFVADLEKALGPAPGAPNFTFFDRGEIDSGTVREEIEREVDYLIDAAAYAIDHLDFDLLMMDGAVFDRVGHPFHVVDPRQKGWDGEAATRTEDHWRWGYRLADAAVDSILEQLGSPSRTALVLTSEYGISPAHTRIAIHRLLADAGLDVASDHAVLRAFAGSVSAHLRIRPDLRTDGKVEEVATILRDFLDPVTGEPVVDLVATGESLEALHLDHPERAGDLWVRLRSGYTFDGTLDLERPLWSVPRFPGEHGYAPTPATRGFFLVHGPGLGAGLPGEIDAVDVAVTVAGLLGIKAPHGSEGQKVLR